jgi:hypothetical protein
MKFSHRSPGMKLGVCYKSNIVSQKQTHITAGVRQWSAVLRNKSAPRD